MTTAQFGDARLPERFWGKTRQADGGCWEWTGALHSKGYAMFSYGGKRSAYGHRVSHEVLVGPIPDGFQIDHLCRNRPCVNPAHLEAVTQRTNLLRGETLAAKNMLVTHCPQDHEYTPENTRRTAPGYGRTCRECGNEWQRNNYQRKKEERAARLGKSA